MDTALQPLPDEMAQVGSGGELIPVGMEGGALVLRNTVEHPHYVTADAGRDRLDLASQAGVLELALDTVETIRAANSLEKMLAHQLAAAHQLSMIMAAQANRCIENMEHYNSDAQERANIQGTRLAGAIARMLGTFQSGMLALQKMRSGGQQTVRVVHQHVQVNEGAQAVVAGEMNTGQATGGRRKRVGGRAAKMSKAAHANDWQAHLALAHAAPRCGARCRNGGSCRQAAMGNGRCRMHGGKSTGPRTPEGLERSRRANWKHGLYSAEAKAARQDAGQSIRLLRRLLAFGF